MKPAESPLPPPIPVQPLSYAPADAADRTRPVQAAKAAWMAPILAAVFGILTSVARDQDRIVAITVAIANVLIIVIGLIAAIYALFSVRRCGTKSILVPAIIGLLINSLLVSSVVATFMAARRTATLISARQATAQLQQQQQLKKIEQDATDAVIQFPGWFGAVELDGGATLVVTEWNNHAPGTRNVKSEFGADFTLVTVAVNNTDGTRSIDVEPLSLIFWNEAGEKITPLSAKAILGTAKLEPQRMLEQFGAHTRLIAPGESLDDGLVFLPADCDLSSMTAAIVTVDSESVTVAGRRYHASEKQAFFDAAQVIDGSE